MILLFDPDPPIVRIYIGSNNSIQQYDCEMTSDWAAQARNIIGNVEHVRGAATLLYHGGNSFQNSITPVTSETFEKINAAQKWLPESNEWSKRIAREMYRCLPGIPHFILCESAFFSQMHAEAATYAIPFSITQGGIKRYGSSGLCHQWAWEKSQTSLSPAPRKVISAQMGNKTSLAAIKDGQAVETTIGFTPVEGILSSMACGDIDPTIIFHLTASGAEMREINYLLSRESGFAALLGESCSYRDLMNNKDEPRYSFIRKILGYQMIKYIGAFTSILGGVDAIAFSGDPISESFLFIRDLCKEMEFLGIHLLAENYEQSGVWRMTEDNSLARAIGVDYARPQILIEQIKQNITGDEKK